MKKTYEFVGRINSHYVADDCIQIMLAYRNYLLLFGNNSLMYYRNYNDTNPLTRNSSVNDYLDDERKDILSIYKSQKSYLTQFLQCIYWLSAHQIKMAGMAGLCLPRRPEKMISFSPFLHKKYVLFLPSGSLLSLRMVLFFSCRAESTI